MLLTDPWTRPEAAEIYSCIDTDVDIAAVKDMAKTAKTADIVAKLKRLLHVSTTLGLATKKIIAIQKRGLKKLKYNN